VLIDRDALEFQDAFSRCNILDLDSLTQRGAHFQTEAGRLEVSFYAPDIVHLTVEKKRQPDYSLLMAPAEVAGVSVSTGKATVRLRFRKTIIEMIPVPLRIRVIYCGKVILQSTTDVGIGGNFRIPPFAYSKDKWVVSFALRNGEPVYGLGEKYGALNRRGQLVTSWNEDALGVSREASYKNVPFAWSPTGWGIFVNTTSRTTHGVGYPQWSNRSYVLTIDDINLDLFIIAGQTPAEIIGKYTDITGRCPLLPRWSYGTWMSRAYYHNANEALAVARDLRFRRIPCDVIVLDGRAWHKMEYRFDFSWDRDRYPDPAAFIKELKGLNFRLCLWEYPYISVRNPLFRRLARKGYLLKTREGQTYVHRWVPKAIQDNIPQLQPSGIIDLTNPAAYSWYLNAHAPLFEVGTDVMKTDYGEAVSEDVVAYNGDSGKRLHNVFSILYNRCVFEATQKFGKGKPLVWGRAGWASSQRYPIQWGGDPSGDWEGLASSIRGSLSWGMSGAPFYSHDIGGFGTFGSTIPETELYVRWAQAGVMSSHTRFHGTSPREPWVFGKKIEKIVRSWLGWRYRLIPYLESCVFEAQQTGLPVARAMTLAFPHESAAWGFEEQYMLGPSLLVAPVVNPGGGVSVFLPGTHWYDIWTGERLRGGRILNLVMPLDRIPVYGHEGGILPLGPPVQHTGQLRHGHDINEIWVFGFPKRGIRLPDWVLDIETIGNGTAAINLPEKIKVQVFGKVSMIQTGNRLVFRRK